MASGQEIINAQVSAGMCELGTEPGYCKAGGQEVGCNFVRECRPDLHFEYLSGSGGLGSGNANVWVYQEEGGVPQFIWSGPGPAPTYAPTLGIDPFSGGYMPTADLTSYFTATVPPQVVSGGPRGNQTPVNQSYAVTNPSVDSAGSVAGPSTAPAFQGGLLQRLRQFAEFNYGSGVISQAAFCRAYQELSGFPCDFANSMAGARDVSDWLQTLQSDQDLRVRVVGSASQAGTGGLIGTNGGGAMVPAIVGNTLTPPTPKSDNSKLMLVALVALGAFVAYKS